MWNKHIVMRDRFVWQVGVAIDMKAEDRGVAGGPARLCPVLHDDVAY
jgi:hypothetical protein